MPEALHGLFPDDLRHPLPKGLVPLGVALGVVKGTFREKGEEFRPEAGYLPLVQSGEHPGFGLGEEGVVGL